MKNKFLVLTLSVVFFSLGYFLGKNGSSQNSTSNYQDNKNSDVSFCTSDKNEKVVKKRVVRQEPSSKRFVFNTTKNLAEEKTPTEEAGDPQSDFLKWGEEPFPQGEKEAAFTMPSGGHLDVEKTVNGEERRVYFNESGLVFRESFKPRSGQRITKIYSPTGKLQQLSKELPENRKIIVTYNDYGEITFQEIVPIQTPSTHLNEN